MTEATSERFRIELVWPSVSEELQDEAMQFWAAEAAIPYEQALHRKSQLLAIARDDLGKTVGTSTAYSIHIDHLGFSCFYYRSYVARQCRAIGLRSMGLGRRLLLSSYALLNRRFQSGHDPATIALYLEIQNLRMIRARSKAVWRAENVDFVFIGKTESGRDCRIAYFDSARLPRSSS